MATDTGLQPRTIEREGPTGLITTTTAVRLHPENETRLLSLTITDSPEQTKAVLLAQARPALDAGPLQAQWRRLQSWLETADHDVVIPYAEGLAELIPPVAVRLRRDFPAVLSLVRAHALLHQATRPRDAEDRVVAALADYAAVRDLVGDLIADGAGQAVPESIRQTVVAVRDCAAETVREVTVQEVAGALGIDKSAASRRVRVALDRGHLRNLEDRRGRPSRLFVGDPLPDEVVILPEPARLHGCSESVRDTEVGSAPSPAGRASPHALDGRDRPSHQDLSPPNSGLVQPAGHPEGGADAARVATSWGMPIEEDYPRSAWEIGP